MKILNLKGKACPIPVIETKKTLESCDENETVLTIVDNEIAMQNVSKLAKELNYNFQTKTVDSKHYEIITIKGEGNETAERAVADLVVVIDKLEMGHGDDELGLSLRKAMIHTIQDLDILPSHILVYNSGVKMIEDEGINNDLKALEELGINILFCGACLLFFNLDKRLTVGSSTNMYEILSTQTKAKKVLAI
jgi:selenium metabolism protein YedF